MRGVINRWENKWRTWWRGKYYW